MRGPEGMGGDLTAAVIGPPLAFRTREKQLQLQAARFVAFSAIELHLEEIQRNVPIFFTCLERVIEGQQLPQCNHGFAGQRC